jgi:3-phenylpropionate/trans-cinnamate dioxygenase ferredoxin subunit
LVAPVEEIPPGERRIVEIDRRSIGVFNVGGHFHALRNRCPHQGGPLCEGQVLGAVHSSGPGDFQYDADRRILACPWHGWEFDLATGQSWCDPGRLRTRAYAARVARGRELAADAHDLARVPGPHVAETYTVSVDGCYVVLDVPG